MLISCCLCLLNKPNRDSRVIDGALTELVKDILQSEFNESILTLFPGPIGLDLDFIPREAVRQTRCDLVSGRCFAPFAAVG